MKPITSGQKEQCVTVIKDVARKGGEEAITELADSGTINESNFQRILGLGNKLAPKIKAFVKEQLAELVENIAGYVRLISGAVTLALEPTDGTETIAKANEVFTWGIDGDFRNWGCDVKAEPTKKQNVVVHEMIKDGTFAQIFNGLGDNLNELDQFVKHGLKQKYYIRYADDFVIMHHDKDSLIRVLPKCAISWRRSSN